MKRLILLFLLFAMLSQVVSADSIMPGTKSISYCSKITNADDFSDYYIIGMIEGPIGRSATIIHNNECFNLGYKFNRGNYYSIKKEDYDVLKGINHTINEFKPEQIAYFDWRTFEPFLEQLVSNKTIEKIPVSIENIHRTSIADPKTSITDIHTLHFEEGAFKVTSKRVKEYNYAYFLIILISIISVIFIVREFKKRNSAR